MMLPSADAFAQVLPFLSYRLAVLAILFSTPTRFAGRTFSFAVHPFLPPSRIRV